MNAIVNVTKNWGIGKDNKLLCHIKEDMDFFKEKTMGKVIIYGNNTLKSFPNKAPLSGRINIVISKDINNISQESKDQSSFCNDIKIKNYNLTIYVKNTIANGLFPTDGVINRKTNKIKTLLLYANSIEKAIEFARQLAYDEDIFVCGGASIYNQFMSYVDDIYVTKNECDKEADTFFPNLDDDVEWMIKDQKSIITKSNQNLTFYHYIRIDKFIRNNNQLNKKIKALLKKFRLSEIDDLIENKENMDDKNG